MIILVAETSPQQPLPRPPTPQQRGQQPSARIGALSVTSSAATAPGRSGPAPASVLARSGPAAVSASIGRTSSTNSA